ncbi:hypothetical protein BHM03_00028376, partial [Ensete ventricosum]
VATATTVSGSDNGEEKRQQGQCRRRNPDDRTKLLGAYARAATVAKIAKKKRKRRRGGGEVPRAALAATLPEGRPRAVAARGFFSPCAGRRNVSPHGREFEATSPRSPASRRCLSVIVARGREFEATMTPRENKATPPSRAGRRGIASFNSWKIRRRLVLSRGDSGFNGYTQ